MKRQLILFACLLVVVLSVSATYYRYYSLLDFENQIAADCDPQSESCFVWICDPEVDGEDYCTGDPEEDTWYYKFIYKNSSSIPLCDPYDEDCSAFECDEEQGCYEVQCTDETLIEYEIEGDCYSELIE